jgi:uncharacterized protein YuzE
MRAEYDPGADALYIYLVDEDLAGKLHDNIEVDDVYLNVDVDREGRPMGIEVLWASKGFDLGPVIERFRLEELRPQLMEIQRREFEPDLAWKKSSPAG